MNIRDYLLRALLPGLVLFAICTALFFYQINGLTPFAGVGAIIAFLYLLIRIYFFSEFLNKPLMILKEDALSNAAGNYQNSPIPKAPVEIKELAEAMGTMNECFQENLSRLKESSALRERLHGEYECAVLLQHYMFANVIDEQTNPHLSIRPIIYRSTSLPHGVLLKLTNTSITLCEADKNGFESMYDLLLQQDNCSKKIQIDFTKKFSQVDWTCQSMPLPLIWSTSQEKMVDNRSSLEKEDLIFLYNEGFAKCFENAEQVEKWFQKVLRHFATEGIELFLTMLNCEISFLTRKLHIDHDINILCIQIK